MIVQTKFNVPGLDKRLVQRTELYEKLNQGLHHKISVLIATTGSGKSTLLGQWAWKVQYPVCWIPIDISDNHQNKFWQQMLTSLASILPTLNNIKLSDYLEVSLSDTTFIDLLLDELIFHEHQLILIWDDFHFLTNDSLLESIDYFLKHIPNHIHVFVASRVQPPISLSNYRLRREIQEIHNEDMSFSYEEGDQLFNHGMNLGLCKDTTQLILERTEGWVAGMKMIALMLEKYKEQKIPIHQELVESIHGGQGYIAQYFLEEIFQILPPEKQIYLLQTSVLEWMNVPLIEEVTNQDHGQVFLNYVIKENLFLTPKDYRNTWFRYHHLFKEFLQEQFLTQFPEMKIDVHFNAARWLEEKGYSSEALDHYIAAEAYDFALHLLTRMIPNLLEHDHSSITRWLRNMPNDLLYMDPTLYVISTVSLYISGYQKEAVANYWWIKKRLTSDNENLSKKNKKVYNAGLDFMAAYRYFLDRNFQALLNYTKKHPQLLSEGDLFIYQNADKNNHHLFWNVFLIYDHGPGTGETLKNVLSLWEDSNNEAFYAHLCIDYSYLLYEQNRLKEAEEYARKAMYIAEETGIMALLFSSKFLMIKTALVLMQIEKAILILDGLEEQIDPSVYPFIAKKVQVFRWVIQKYIKIGNGRFIKDINEVTDITNEFSPFMLQETYLISMQHYYECKQMDEEKLFQMLEIAKKEQYYQIEVKGLLLRSQLYFDLKQYLKTYQVLELALSVAKREGFVRTVLDGGENVERVIQHYIESVQKNHFTAANKEYFHYAKQLMTQFAVEPRKTIHSNSIENHAPKKILLTAKEQIVLTCIDKGMSNREIAVELNVSLSTIKTHINHLYAKLEVSNRILAIQKARELEIL